MVRSGKKAECGTVVVGQRAWNRAKDEQSKRRAQSAGCALAGCVAPANENRW